MGSHRKPWTSNILIFSVYCEFHHNSEIIIMNTFLRLHHLASLKAFIPDVFTGFEERKYNHNGCYVCQKSPFEVKMWSVRSCWLGNVCIIWNEAFFCMFSICMCMCVVEWKDIETNCMFPFQECSLLKRAAFSVYSMFVSRLLYLWPSQCVSLWLLPQLDFIHKKKKGFLHVNIFIGKISLTT